MNRDRALAELAGRSSEVEAHGVRALYLFGSTARDMAGDDSDVDIFIEAEQADRFNAFDLVDVKTTLERRPDAHVDLTTREALHPRLREQIEREAIGSLMARGPGIVQREAGRYSMDRRSRHRQRDWAPICVAVGVAYLECRS